MQILLKIIDGASVALVCDDENSKPEMLQTRYDLYRYRGGVAWGYKGSGVQSLSYAIAGRLSEDVRDIEVHRAAGEILDNILSKLEGDQEHIIDHSMLIQAVSALHE